MATVIFETDRYSFATHRGGGASITRKGDNKSVFFQPGDVANELIEAVEGVYSQISQTFFNAFCDPYEPLFEARED